MSNGADFADGPRGPGGAEADAFAAGAAEVLGRLELLRVALIRLGGADRRITAWEGAAEDVFGFTVAEAVGFRPEALPIATPEVALRLREILLSKPEVPLEHDLHLLRKDGTAFPARVRTTLDFAADGSVAGSCVLVLDTTSARVADASLPSISSLGPVAGLGTLAIGGLDREDLIDRAVAIVGDSLGIDLVGVFALDAEAGALELEGGRGWANGEGEGPRIPLISPELVAILRTGRGAVVSDSGGRELLPDGFLAASGACDGLSVPIGDPFRPSGALVAFSKSRRSFSRQEIEFMQATSHVLSAAWERERSRALEMRFQRLSRIEAMGQLTGGIAHDFNNLLAVILNHASFTRDNLDSREAEGAAGQSLDEIETAATRAAELTHQLLVFSRQDVVDVQAVDVAAAVASAERMLVRTVGEGVEVETELEPGLRPIEAGPGQIEQIVVNLVVNARDAMPGGGCVRIAVDRAGRSDAGYRWIRITVSDDGIGMRTEVIEKAFEPFFTTKPVGEGSGLGLATVYGIVSGLGGSIELASEPGEGTHVDILLPVAEEERDADPSHGGAPAAAQPELPDPAPPSRRQVLLVEDDPMVRRLTARVLSEGGYDVVVAEDAPAALALVRQPGSGVEVVLTDVVMPGMSGVELAEAIREMVPGICVVFMSGYTGDSISREAVRDFEAGFVEKPFTPETLLTGVAAAFDRA